MAEAEATARCGRCGNTVAANMTVQLGGKTICVSCKSDYAREMAGARPVGAFRYAGFWIRFAAVFIDGLILFIPNMAILFAFGAADFEARANQEFSLGANLLPQVLFLVYETFFLGKFGATPG